MKNVWGLLWFLFLTCWVQPVFADCEQFDFGSSNTRYNIYSDGRIWNFTATKGMNVSDLEVKTITTRLPFFGGWTDLLSSIKINNTDITDEWSVTWSVAPNNVEIHSVKVDHAIQIGDTITFKIRGGLISDPAGYITGPNYVKLCDQSSHSNFPWAMFLPAISIKNDQ